MSRHDRFHIPEVVALPSIELLPVHLVRRLQDVDQILKEIQATDINRWRALHNLSEGQIFVRELARFSEYFSDPLLSTYKDYHQTRLGPKKSRTCAEIILLPNLVSALNNLYLDNDKNHFIASLETISSLILGRHSSVRDKSVFIARDSYGRSVQFPSHKNLRRLISSICEFLVCSGTPIIYKATVSYVLFVGAHPFLDGNGRLGRIFFNAILVSGGLRYISYIPMKELFDISQGALAIQTRRALMHSDWEPVLDGFCAAVEITHAINSINH